MIRSRSILISLGSIAFILMLVLWSTTDSKPNSKQLKKKIFYNLMEETKGIQQHVKDCTIGEFKSDLKLLFWQQFSMIKLSLVKRIRECTQNSTRSPMSSWHYSSPVSQQTVTSWSAPLFGLPERERPICRSSHSSSTIIEESGNINAAAYVYFSLYITWDLNIIFLMLM